MQADTSNKKKTSKKKIFMGSPDQTFCLQTYQPQILPIEETYE